MYPNLFGINDSSYVLMIVLGVIAAFIVLILYLKNKGADKGGILDILICSVFAILGGFAGGVLTQNLYEVIRNPNTYKWTWGMTFYGGLFFGVVVFVLLFLFVIKSERRITIQNILIIAPGCITLAHAFGRIGCFLAGCCYGVETDSWIGMPCSCMDDLNHVPTQLIEALFLFILSSGLIFIAFKYSFKYNFCIYITAYAIFRFIIEYFRGDDRGGLNIAISPSQIWCIVLILFVVPLWLFLKYIVFKENVNKYE